MYVTQLSQVVSTCPDQTTLRNLAKKLGKRVQSGKRGTGTGDQESLSQLTAVLGLKPKLVHGSIRIMAELWQLVGPGQGGNTICDHRLATPITTSGCARLRQSSGLPVLLVEQLLPVAA